MTSRLTQVGMVCLLSLATGTAVRAAGVADEVTLKDGQVVRGLIQESTLRSVLIVVRRAWGREHLRDWPARWDAVEGANLKGALTRRRERLSVWRKDRAAGREVPDRSDRITNWIDTELKRLENFDAAKLPLQSVRINRFDVKQVAEASRESRTFLRLAWLSEFPDPEAMSVEAVREALEGRGFDLTQSSEASIDALLPPRAESDESWMTRRAATEVLHDPGLRFIKYQGLVMPDAAQGAGLPRGVEALSALRSLIGEAQDDPLPGRLRAIEATGRVGAVLTNLEIAPDFSMVAVEVSLLVKSGPGRWRSAGSRTARIRPDDLGPEAGKDLANDPQVAMAFQLIEAVGLREVSQDMRRRSLAVGASTQRALAAARSAADRDLQALSMPVLAASSDEASAPAPQPAPAPPQ